MTKTQERWNALTVVQSPIYCLYFILAAKWITESTPQSTFVNDTSQEQCLPQSNWHSMPALPPLPVVAVAVAIIAHAPCSFLYHWKYAHALPPGAARTNHWSRRLDQSMIHFTSACLSYATSGSWDFFFANCLFNIDCIVRQFQPKVRPRRNQVRIGISVFAYSIPILRRGDWVHFIAFWLVMITSGWLFVHYPIGGWSHAAFHLVVALAPPILLQVAMQLPASQDQIQVAAACALLQSSHL